MLELALALAHGRWYIHATDAADTPASREPGDRRGGRQVNRALPNEPPLMEPFLGSRGACRQAETPSPQMTNNAAAPLSHAQTLHPASVFLQAIYNAFRTHVSMKSPRGIGRRRKSNNEEELLRPSRRSRMHVRRQSACCMRFLGSEG